VLKIRLVSTRLKSNSLKLLAAELSQRVGYKVWRDNTPLPHRRNLVYGAQVDKIQQYAYFAERGLPALQFTTNRMEAREWAAQGEVVVCRTLTRSEEGKGIILAETPEQVVAAPVYTLYRKKKREYRVHVFQGKIVAILEKRKKKGFEGQRETKIRNTANGYVFCSVDVVIPSGMEELAQAAALVTKSDFAGVDLGYNEKLDQLFIIEVNSAPGMEGSTVVKYANTILEQA
jgi:glutathione synthase/RimK-type ligase-like ATP-grasp enzyme